MTATDRGRERTYSLDEQDAVEREPSHFAEKDKHHPSGLRALALTVVHLEAAYADVAVLGAMVRQAVEADDAASRSGGAS